MKAGEKFPARVISRDGDSSLIKVAGNTYRASIPSGMPDSIILRFEGMRDGRALFSFEGAGKSIHKIFPDFQSQAVFIRSLHAGGIIFDSLKKGAGVKNDDAKKVMKDIASKMISSGASASAVSFFSRASDAALHPDNPLLFVFDAAESEVSRFADEFQAELLEYLTAFAGEPRYGFFYVHDGDNLRELEYFFEKSLFAVSFELSAAGKVDIVGRMKSDNIVTDVIVQDADFLYACTEGAGQLVRKIRGAENISLSLNFHLRGEYISSFTEENLQAVDFRV